MRILNFGSLNIDHVYRVKRIARPGETVDSESYQIFAGGKGANQTAAWALAGAQGTHAGAVGPDGGWLIDKLAAFGADTSGIVISEHPTGHAVIQIDPGGENSILIHGGANRELPRAHMQDVLSRFNEGDILLLQNEINQIHYLISEAFLRRMKIYFNPAPFAPTVLDHPLHQLSGMILNETEAAGMVGTSDTRDLPAQVAENLHRAEVVLTMGARGCQYLHGEQRTSLPARETEIVDTTAAGDTFIGFFLAQRSRSLSVEDALLHATTAAGLCVSRSGAMDSIPTAAEVAGAL